MMMSARCVPGAAIFLLVQLSASHALAGPDKNGLEKRALYTITTQVGGKTLAWTHIVPEGTPKNLIGTNADKSRVELRPLASGDKGQQWVVRPDSETDPEYKLVPKLASN